MEPPERRSFAPAEAGALLAGVTLVVIGMATLVGWLAGSLKIGLIVGAVLGLPAGVGCVYVRYHESF